MIVIVLVSLVGWISGVSCFSGFHSIFQTRQHTASELKMSKSDSYLVHPISHFTGEVILPGSKSLSNRVLLLAALSKGTTQIDNLLDSADTQYMLAALKDLNIPVTIDLEKRQAVITGNGGPIDSLSSSTVSSPQRLYLGNAGTAMRPLTAVLSAGQGHFELTGTPRMLERPIADLVDGLQQLKVDISCSNTGCPPVFINANGLQGGGKAVISGQISSQYLSALLMAAPLATGEQPTVIQIHDELMSAPYVLMTVKLMARFGVQVDVSSDLRFFTIPSRQTYQSPEQIFIEGDASSASYFLAGAALCPIDISSSADSSKEGVRGVTVQGCGEQSVQGDARFAQVLKKMGCTVQYGPNSISLYRDINSPLKGVDEDCGDIPDVAMTLAVLGAFAEGKTTIRNVYNWRVKETERMVAMVTELTKLGVKVEEGRDFLIVHGLQPGQKLKPNVDIETYDDHRVAMCFSLAACGGVPVNILDPACTSKTFPDFFQQLERVTR